MKKRKIKQDLLYLNNILIIYLKKKSQIKKNCLDTNSYEIEDDILNTKFDYLIKIKKKIYLMKNMKVMCQNEEILKI